METSPQKYENESEKLESQVKVFNDIISNSYLNQLSDCEIVTPHFGEQADIRWYKITKIVIEKDTFFLDKLSMLYMSLHEKAKTVLLVLNKVNNGNVELYLGVRDYEGINSVSGSILESGLQGYLPGVDAKKVSKIKHGVFKTSYISSVSAIASLRDDKKQNFVQGIEKLINATCSIPEFTTYFIADSVGTEEAESMINSFNNLYTSLSPFSESQITISESKADSVSESLSKGFADSVSKNISKTISHSTGTNSSYSHSEGSSESNSENRNVNILRGIVSKLFGGKTSSSSSYSKNFQETTSRGESTQEGVSDQTGESTGHTTNETKQTGTSQSTTFGSSRQITLKNNQVKHYLDIIDKNVDRISKGMPFGLWSVATYFVAPAKTTAVKLANLYRGCIIGEESNLSICAVNSWEKSKSTKDIAVYLENGVSPLFHFNDVEVSAGTIVTSKELAIHMSLPQTSVPGILVREEAPFGRNVISSNNNDEKNSIYLGNILHLGNVNEDCHVRLDVDSLTKHTFITGTTGSGKSNTMYLLLTDLYKKGKKFLVIEPAKGEYKNIFGNEKDVYVYGSNPKVSRLLKINPFVFPDDIHVFEHIDRLVGIFNACWPMSAAMPVVLKNSIINAYKSCGWNVESSTWKGYGHEILYPTFKDVESALWTFINESAYSAETKGDYIGSLATRLSSLTNGLNGTMFNSSTDNCSDEDLFEENVIADLSRIGDADTKSLVMGILIMKLNEYYQSKGTMNSSLRHITVLEEAHNILKKTDTTQVMESSNLAGKSVEMIGNSIAEMRTYGEGFIIVDQSPSQVDMAAIRNTNTKIIMSLPEAKDRETAGKSIGLNDDQINEIGKQKTGQAIVYQNSWEEPVQCQINLFEKQNGVYRFHQAASHQDAASDNDLQEILNFLYSIFNEKPIGVNEFEKIEKNISHCDLQSSLKFKLLSLLHNREENGTFKVDKHLSTLLMELAAQCIGEINEIARVTSLNNNVEQINDEIKDRLKQKNIVGTEKFYRFCIRCALRLQVSKDSDKVELYNNWILHYYKKTN